MSILRQTYLVKREAGLMDALERDRFDLEAAISSCWGTKEDIDLLYEEMLEGESSSEDLANALLGLSRLHEMRCGKAIRIFEELIQAGKII
jgi:hypothetical protein